MVEEKKLGDKEVPEDKTVQLDLIINSIRYAGMAIVHPDERVDLSSIIDDDYSKQARFCGVNLVPVRDVLRAYALNLAGYKEHIGTCSYSLLTAPIDRLIVLHDGRKCFPELAEEWQGEFYYMYDGSRRTRRFDDGEVNTFWAPDEYWQDLYYCNNCDCYVDYDHYHGDDLCETCYEELHENDTAPIGVIESYGESHEHKPILFGEYKSEEEFQGLGFELEVDTTDDEDPDNYDAAQNLCGACGLEEDEMRYAHDGSLNYGFECISQPHTVKDFWDKADKWRRMLSYLADRGYESHNPGTCGLHVHVSRTMFGANQEEQDKAIAKVYTFFDDNWDDLIKVSRRRDTGYCAKNKLSANVESEKGTKYNKWRKSIKGENAMGHYVALNNRNKATFEYRLGRGTLNAWSFFSWIDLMLTITKNARRITINKVNSNDIVSWLGGIKESTAKYIYKRGAFRPAVLALYPSIEWETDLTDN
jgi:hypothetical protein